MTDETQSPESEDDSNIPTGGGKSEDKPRQAKRPRSGPGSRTAYAPTGLGLTSSLGIFDATKQIRDLNAALGAGSVVKMLQAQKPLFQVPDYSSSALAITKMFEQQNRLVHADLALGIEKVVEALRRNQEYWLRPLAFSLDTSPFLKIQDSLSSSAAAMVASLNIDLKVRFRDDIIKSTAIARSIAGLSNTLGTASLAYRQGTMLIESYQLFESQLLIHHAKAEVPEVSPFAVVATEIATAALSDSVSHLEEVSDTDAIPEGDPVPPTFFDALYSSIEHDLDQWMELPAEEAEERLSQSLVPTIGAKAKQLITARWETDEASQMIGNGPVFISTPESPLHACILCTLAATDREGFAVFMDTLYKFILESSTLAKVYMNEQKIVNDPQILKDIHTLRNFYRHGQGLAGEKQRTRTYQRVSALMQGLTGTRDPRTPEHWLRAQLSVLLQLVSYFGSLRQAIAEIGSKNHA